MENKSNIIKFSGISKNFGGVRALRDVSFAVPEREIHTLVGENGAGKSTLIRICGGVYHPDQGKVEFDGKEVHFDTVQESQNAGISIVHQEIPICSHMTAAENIFLGHDLPKKRGLIDWQQVNENAKGLFERLQVEINPKTLASDLSIAQQQMVVIAQALSLDSKLLIMDEPTSALNKNETGRLFDLLRKLKDQGLTIIYVSHRLEEVFEIADRISALRDGRYVGTVLRQETAPEEVVRMMVGRSVENVFPKDFNKLSEKPILSVRSLTVPGRFSDVSFDLFGGEVLGLVGLQGSGTSDVLRALYGVYPDFEGRVTIHGRSTAIHNSLDAMKKGIAYVPADRQIEGLYSHMSVRDNAGLLLLRRLTKALKLISLNNLDAQVENLVKNFGIRTSSIQAPITSLSGGNQQKVVIARSLSTDPIIVLLDDPTRGIDVGAKSEVHMLLNRLTAQGFGVLLVSSELPEVLAMSDRVIVMYRGDVRAVLNYEDSDDHELVMALATGADMAADVENGKSQGSPAAV